MGHPMTTAQAIAMLAYDIAEMVDRNDGYDGLIPADRMTQDELIDALPALFRALGITPLATATPIATATPAPGTTPFVKHTCRNGRGPAYGRLAPVGDCVRCDALRDGAPRREAPPWIRNSSRNTSGYPTAAEHTAHFAAGGPHQTRCAGTVCTFGEW